MPDLGFICSPSPFGGADPDGEHNLTRSHCPDDSYQICFESARYTCRRHFCEMLTDGRTQGPTLWGYLGEITYKVFCSRERIGRDKKVCREAISRNTAEICILRRNRNWFGALSLVFGLCFRFFLSKMPRSSQNFSISVYYVGCWCRRCRMRWSFHFKRFL